MLRRSWRCVRRYLPRGYWLLILRPTVVALREPGRTLPGKAPLNPSPAPLSAAVPGAAGPAVGVTQPQRSEDGRSRSRSLPAGLRIVVLIGPEGDFSREEAAMAIAAGFIPVHLGPSRLRTETAALTAVEAVYLHNI